jgi:hypothetical protein
MRKTTSKQHQTSHTIADNDRSRPAPVDYGPALDAVENLFKWAFGLAAKDVAGWPDGKERVRNARRHLLKSLRGKATGRIPNDDLLFTAGLLARIFESELRVPRAAIVRMLSELELPTEVVPRIVQAPTAWSGVVRRYPTPPPRTEEEEDAHWSFLVDEFLATDDEDELLLRRWRSAPAGVVSPCACASGLRHAA